MALVCLLLAGLMLTGPTPDMSAMAGDEFSATTAVNARSDTVSADATSRKPASKQESDAAIKFATEHHADLAVLLRQLRDTDQPGFSRALEEVTADMKRLERVRERSPQRYQHELESWKLDSQARLLMARWVVSRDQDLQRQVRSLLKQRRELKTQLLTAEKARLSERLEVVNKQLEDSTRNPDQAVDDEWRLMARKAGVKSSPPASDKVKITDKPKTTDKAKPANKNSQPANKP